MKTQFNQEFAFEREVLLMNSDWDAVAHDHEIDTLLQQTSEDRDLPYFSNTFMWEELEGINKFIDAAGF